MCHLCASYVALFIDSFLFAFLFFFFFPKVICSEISSLAEVKAMVQLARS